MDAGDDFTLDDFRKQLDSLEEMDDLRGAMARMPDYVGEWIEAKESLRRTRRMIDSMTEEERRDPRCIDDAGCRRIAAASDTEPEEVRQFLEQFEQVRELVRQMARLNVWECIKRMTGLQFRDPPPEDEDEE